MQLLGSHGQPAWVKVPAVIFTMRFERMTYPACTGERAGKMCQKKMIPQDNGSYYCESCQREGQPTWRYLLNMSIIDFDSQLQNVSVFGETGESVMNGLTADRVHEVLAESFHNTGTVLLLQSSMIHSFASVSIRNKE
jgi:hypothetical protein